MTEFAPFSCILCHAQDAPTHVASPVKGDPSLHVTAVRCARCNHVQLYPPEYDLDLYHKDGQVAAVVSGYGTPMAKVFEHSRIEAKRRADRFAQHGINLASFGSRLKLIDVGGGYGFFGAEVLRRVSGAEVTVMEPSSTRVETGRAELSASGPSTALPRFEVGVLDEAFANANAGAFDIVTLWHVLEHVPDPATLIRLALRLLRPGVGRLCIEVPNFEDDLLGLSESYRQRHFMIEHISYFTPSTLEAVAKLADHSGHREVFGYQRYGIFNYFHWAHFNTPQGANPDMHPGEDRWWLESQWRSHKEQTRTSDALFMVLNA